MGKKSHKKEHKKKNHTKKKHRSSSSSSNSSDDQWVEKSTESSPPRLESVKPKEKTDNWMNFICNTSTTIEKKINSKKKDLDDAKTRMEKPGQSERELNPYWKNGGTGLPPSKPLSHKGFLKPKIDNDDYHYNSHQQSNHIKTYHGHQSWKKHDYNKTDRKYDSEKQTNEDRYKHREYDKKKEENDRYYKKNDERSKEKKEYSDESRREIDKPHRELNDERSEDKDRSNRKYNHKIENKSKHREFDKKETHEDIDEKHKNYIEYNLRKTEDNKEEIEKSLTDFELNTLAAKQLKAELMGNTKLAEELKKKLDSARNCSSSSNNNSKTTKQKEEFVLLTRTSSKGYSYPVKPAQSEKSDKNRKREKVLTHEDGKRVRYFDDDDKYSLKSMFEKEMTSTAEDSNIEFIKLSRKVNSRDDEDDIFVERASEKQSAKKSEREIKRAIDEHKRTEKVLNSCRYCFDSKEMLKHLFIAKGEKCYLCLPSYKSLTDGHCLIVPIYHYACATDIDEDVWTEMQVFRKVLTSMFKNQDEDVIFFESAMRLHNMPHMIWNCVPVPIEIGDTSPIYFKKAIMECETEWAINKKVVDLSSKDIRRAVPKSLPYFAVDFGMQGGYAHVIEDEKLFPNNFAEEIIGGMMDLDHNVWRKKQKESIDEQLQKTTKFLEMWKEYDFTKK